VTTQLHIFTICIMKKVYHYTTGDRFQSIANAGEIIPATYGVLPPEKPAVWLSTAEEWEHTATKGIMRDGEQHQASLAEMAELCGCLVRLEIDPSKVKLIMPLNLRKSLKIDRQLFEGLIASAEDQGADPMEWRAVIGSIPVSAIVNIEFANKTNPIQWFEPPPDESSSRGA